MKGKIIGISLASIFGLFVFIFILELFGLGMFKFFEPKRENIRREIFEQTQSYVHGKIQDLAKYQDEYNRAETPEEKEAIRQLIILRFAEFDESQIKSDNLKNFLIRTRGY